MDKSVLENEDTSSVEPHKLETEHSIIVKTKQIDLASLAPKNSSPEPDKEYPPLDDNWLALSQDWQSQPYEKADVQALLKLTKKRTLLAKSLLAIDILATVGLIIALIVGLYLGDWGIATIAYLAFASLGSIIFVYYEIKIRLRIWQQCCDSPDKAVANAIAGVESSIKYIKLIKLSCWLLLPAANWYIYVMLKESEKSPWPPFIVMNSFVIVMWVITHWFHKKRHKELAKFASL
ncbi:hypothetical protein [Colwellia psychrerythraea]|uniref:Uncharacterized protein n=1 Tax=Colwellia psychrerythraea TaxID=28229 RepID=A0A099KXM1_COLPS|nr:hypothetical protein [Colwellia psychrerythraea]KGJ94930.1 hypothetical protein GAB14E_2164 [Colwellia psychrerythraea]